MTKLKQRYLYHLDKTCPCGLHIGRSSAQTGLYSYRYQSDIWNYARSRFTYYFIEENNNKDQSAPLVFIGRKISSILHWVSKGAKIRNRYNQVPHLTQYTNGKAKNAQLDTTNESQEVSSFPAGDHKAQINRHAQTHSKCKTQKT